MIGGKFGLFESFFYLFLSIAEGIIAHPQKLSRFGIIALGSLAGFLDIMLFQFLEAEPVFGERRIKAG